MWLGCLRLAEATGRIDCVVQRAARFVLLAGRRGQLHSEPLLQRSTGSVATDGWFRATLKAVIATLTINGARVDPAPFNTHSLRAGGATIDHVSVVFARMTDAAQPALDELGLSLNVLCDLETLLDMAQEESVASVAAIAAR